MEHPDFAGLLSDAFEMLPTVNNAYNVQFQAHSSWSWLFCRFEKQVNWSV